MTTEAVFSPTTDRSKLWQVISASSAGTMIEWYDFYIFGSLGAIISPLFYPADNEVVSFLVFLATFATGFAVRPFGAVVFGRIGDLVGRKHAFLITLLIMGGSTTAIGLLPTYSQIGLFAPVSLVILRLLQGLALGGEYGGAATYVAEHVPEGRRGFYTSFIQTTATVGLFVSLAVILAVRLPLGEEKFADWGWRIPFLLSVLLVIMSYYIRIRLKESPLFSRLRAAGKTSTAPIRDSLGSRQNWKLMILALLGATSGQAVVWYTGQFYALFFLQTVLKINFVTANIIVAAALLLGTPLFVFFGDLSDRIGRKKVMMSGCLIAAISYFPIYLGMSYFAADPQNPNIAALIFLVFIQVVFVTMVYGPIAAFLVELFPARIRYTSMSLPYHIGNGWFGGFTPLIATSFVALTGYIYAGLAFPIAVALMTFFIGTKYLKETHHVRLWDEVHEAEKDETGLEPRRI